MANFEFNLFDELENSDPRVEHFLESRLRARQINSNNNRNNNNSSASKRIHVARIPASIQDSSLRDTLNQFGEIVEYQRQKDSRSGLYVGVA